MAEQEARTSVTVRIAGEEHTIRANAEPDYTRSCARYVDERISDIRGKGALIETHKAAILAALSISDELFQARDDLERMKREVASRVTNLARRLEGELEAGAGQG
jgi:cell division protein ZapA